MIRVRMRVGDLGRMRFAHSPLIEVAESLWIISSRRVQPVHRRWYDETRARLGRVNMHLLGVVVPGHRLHLASFLLPEATDPATTIEQQLQLVADVPADRLYREIEALWHGEPLPEAGRELIRDGAAGPRRVADALWEYWSAAIAPHWREIRAVLDEDVAYRAATLTKGDVGTLLSSLHPKVRLHDEMLQLDIRHTGDKELSGGGLLLVPSVFAWPFLIFDVGSMDPSSLTYPARGVGNLWQSSGSAAADEDTLGALLGRSRAAILSTLAVPYSTTKLALKLGQSPPAVSQHLSVLRRSGLVTSWRSGRSVLYGRTPLATSIVEASGAVINTSVIEASGKLGSPG